ncbi:type I polyketide synthase, partial [Micromonospora parva]|uniref:type I polyketide synthase n=1 Tax=Micromonospora parva TaxID=1464048 RepID=UPI0033C9345B
MPENPRTTEPIAVVGLACRLPHAPDPEEFWSLLRQGRHAVTAVPADRWSCTNTNGGDRWGAFLETVDAFDADFFGVSPREATAMDPQQRLILELCWEALEHGGIRPEQLLGSRTGVFIGAMWDDYATLTLGRDTEGPYQHTVTGVQRGIIANRVSHTLGLRGPSMTTDTGQSSSLVAVHQACESLRRGEATTALAGGVNLNLAPRSAAAVQRFGALSPDGRCFTFDARANGFVRGEGGGIVVLKTLSRARVDGDRVLALIHGGAVNNDGGGRSLTAPSRAGQEEVLRLAYQAAGIDPADVQYVELHGTGTPVGDPVEAAALGAVLGAARDLGESLLVGSAKTNIGHLEGAAGIAGLLKVVLALWHRELPPSLNFDTPNPAIPLDALRLRVCTTFQPWRRDQQPRTAGVSSFGMGGTNCHLVLTEASAADTAPAVEPPRPPFSTLPFTVSGRTAPALRAQAARLHRHVTDHPDLSPTALAYGMATTRTTFEHRAVVLAADRDELLAGLAALAAGDTTATVLRDDPDAGGTVLLVAGDGSATAARWQHLAATYPAYREQLDAVRAEMAAGPAPASGFAETFALLRLIERGGARPDAIAADRGGLAVAAAVAGLLTLTDAAALHAAGDTATLTGLNLNEPGISLLDAHDLSPISAERLRSADRWPAAGTAEPGVRLLRAGRPELDLADDLPAVLAHRYVHGAHVDWTTLYGAPAGTVARIPLPSYAFQRRRYWLPTMGVTDDSAPASQADLPNDGELQQRLAEQTPEEATGILADLVATHTAQVLELDGSTPLDRARTFKALGFDSLMSVELRDRLTRATGVALPSSLAYDYPTVTAVVDRLRALMYAEPDAEPSGGSLPAAADEPIAVVGMACRLPGGVTTPEDLWELVTGAGDAIGDFPTDRGWNLDELYDPRPGTPGRTYARTGGFLHDAAGFDAEFFGISPREALAMDPQQRLLLETSWEALERAGVAPGALRGSQTGVFVGVMAQEYGPRLADADAGAEGYVLTGNSPSVASGRLSYVLGLEGPALTVDTACSSSLVALHLACRSLRTGESSLALAGGATVMATPGIFVEFSQQRGLAPDGRCKAFGADADGTGWAEGVGVVVLERLSDARRNGHPVLAVVRGSAVNQDGASNGLTAPNGPSQQRVIRQALADAGLRPGDVDAVEAHGTGTRLGDPIEAQALLATYGQERDGDQPLWLGSLKSNIGHTQAAAGVAGLIKMVLALRNGVLPATLHAARPTPEVDWSAGAVALLRDQTPWPATTRPRRAAVSAFGVSGTNAHVILEQAAQHAPAGTGPAAAPVVPWVISGEGEAGLRAQAVRLRSWAAGAADLDAVGVAASLIDDRTLLAHRAVVIGSSGPDLIGGLAALATGEEAEQTLRGVAGPVGRTVFVFPGQGAQWLGMARALWDTSEAFRTRALECEQALTPFVDWSLADVLRGEPEAASLERVDVVQPALFAMMVSLAQLWRSFGVSPDAVVGHSQGEIAAACVAGALSLEDAARVVALRSQAIAAIAGVGGMMSLPLPVAAVRQKLTRWEERLSIAAVNGPRSTVVSGDAAALDELMEACVTEGVKARRVPVDYASHSAHVERIRESLAQALAGITPRPAAVPLISTVTASWLDTTGMDAGYWYTNLREQVRFEEATRTLAAQGHNVFIEVSPHPVLVPGIEETLEQAGVDDPVVTGTLRREQGGQARFLASAAELFVRGVSVDWHATLPVSTPSVPLPTYAFQRRRYWIETRASTESAPASAPDEDFWQTVRGGDPDRFASLLGVAAGPGRNSVTALLPALASWNDRRRMRATIDGYRYRAVWRPLPEAVDRPLAGTWLLAVPEEHADHPMVQTARHVLDGSGAETRLVPVGRDAADRATQAASIEAATAGPVAGVLCLLSMTVAPDPRFPHTTWAHVATLALLQALDDARVDVPIWIVTSGAVCTGPSDPVRDPAQALLWGLGTVLAAERPGHRHGLLDLPANAGERSWRRAVPVLASAADGPTGEVEVAVRPHGVLSRRLERAPLPRTAEPDAWAPRGTVLLTGGTGALAGHVAVWMAERGAPHLVLVSRSGEQAPTAGLLRDRITQTGATVTFAACDVTDRAALGRVIAAIPAEHPLSTVVHTAAVLDDATLSALTPDQLGRAAGAKVHGALHLHELTRDLDVTDFLLFSSIAGVCGIPGQGNYAPANAFLDALGAYRRAEGLPARTICWGHWRGEGIGAASAEQALARRGIRSMLPEQALAALGEILDHDEDNVIVCDADWSLLYADRSHPIAAGLVTPPPAIADSAGPVPATSSSFAAMAATERPRALLATVRQHAAAVLGHGTPDAITVDRPFTALGFDSLTVVELRNRLSRALGHTLPTTLLFDHPTPQALATHLLAELAGESVTSPSTALNPTVTHSDDSIAIVGIGCRYPGGIGSPEEFWELLAAGGDAIGGFPADRGWDLERLFDDDPDHRGTSYAREGGFLYDAAEFDAGFFGISPREALAMDPQQRLLLTAAWEALERAGIDPDSLRGSDTGVFAGISQQDYGGLAADVPEELEGYLLTGQTASVISGRVAYTFGFEGPAVTVDTACSSSLVTVHLAVQALRRGECSTALAGGVTVLSTPGLFVEFSRQRGLAVDGRCKAFAAAADGTAFGEGVGVVVLQRLSDARAAGLPVLAVIRGSAVN